MRDPPHRHAGAQHEQAHLRQYHPCNRERIHTSSNDSHRRALVTILGVDALMPSACRGKAPLQRADTRKIVTGQTACRSSPGEAKKSFRENKMKQTMKRNILAFVAAGAIALGGFAIVQAQPGPAGGGG